jgi:hypothetical protein
LKPPPASVGSFALLIFTTFSKRWSPLKKNKMLIPSFVSRFYRTELQLGFPSSLFTEQNFNLGFLPLFLGLYRTELQLGFPSFVLAFYRTELQLGFPSSVTYYFIDLMTWHEHISKTA